MKPIQSVQLLLLALSFTIYSCSSSKYAQSGTSEYDDMYFNKGDRYPVQLLDGTSTIVQRTDQQSNGGVGVGYNSKTLNPDYGLPQDAQADAAYEEDEYYVENRDDAYIQQAVDDYLRSTSTTARRYTSPNFNSGFDDIFWNDPLYYQGTLFDPLYRSYYGVYSPFAYRSFYRPYSSFYRPWGPGLSAGIGFGFGSFYGRYNNPFNYGGGFGYGYGYNSIYNNYYGASVWCPPSYYGINNNTVVINNIENGNTGNVRYGTRTSRGSGYIADGSGIRQRGSNDATANSARIRSRANTTVRQASARTLNNSRIVQQSPSSANTDVRSRNVNQYDQVDNSRARFRTHNLNSKNNSTTINGRTRSNSGLQQRGQTINNDTYRTPNRTLGTRRATDINRRYSAKPSRNSGSSRFGNTPNRSPASSGVRSRSDYSRRSNTPSRVRSSSSGRVSTPSRVRSTPSRTSSPSRVRSSSPSRVSSPSRMRSSSPSRVSSPSRSSMPSRSSGGAVRSVTRE